MRISAEYERPVGMFQLHEFPISSLWIHSVNFVSSRFQHTESTISRNPWIHDINFMNPKIHDFTFKKSTSWIYVLNCTISTLRTKNFMCIHEVKIVKFKHDHAQLKIVNLWRWNRAFMKFKSWIQLKYWNYDFM
jgi:hypothetical protein